MDMMNVCHEPYVLVVPKISDLLPPVIWPCDIKVESDFDHIDNYILDNVSVSKFVMYFPVSPHSLYRTSS